MKRAFIAGAVTEKDDGHFTSALQLSRQRSAHRYGKARADYSVGTKHSDAEVGNVHGAALALAVTGFLSVNLCHHAPQVRPFGNTMTVTPVIADDAVIHS